MGCDAEDIALTIHAHPTLHESVGLAAEVFEGSITDLPNAKGRKIINSFFKGCSLSSPYFLRSHSQNCIKIQ